MCARYVIAAAEKEILSAYAAEMAGEYKPNWNIAPTDKTPVITADQPVLIQQMQFGLIPWHSKSGKLDLSTINAKDYRLLESNLWRPLLVNHKTCLVLTSGFYEWKKYYDGKKVINNEPYFFSVKDRSVFAFAGLWSRWMDPETKNSILSFCIITTESNNLVSEIHEKKRMPVILSKENEKAWLSKDLSSDELVSICAPFPDELMTRHKVSKRINTVSKKTVINNDPDLIQPENSL